MSQLGYGSSSSPCLNPVREVRQSVISSLSVVAIAALSGVLVHLNWDTPQQAVTIAVAISATSTAFAVATGLQTLKAISAVALGVMIAVALTHPTGMAGAWVIGTVLFFVFAVCQPQWLRGRQPQG
ncbi:hypothetical protein SAMN05216355_10194 [Actinomyces ruminicola]|uniref:Uncharacterized protein n=1 Tax=Actinomyces ruminicola TaxID=332524 RepID=A0A1G9ZB71_9ACTO|nr:hypothetical protein [Actinomyces ruminicola]SDN18297.1 hypothetical protein SAMN05216355_10194 [Actinomyces ruminicola]